MAEETITTDPKGQSTTTTDPSGQGGQSTTTNPNPADIDNLPEKFKGKSASEIAKAYTELEKTYGTHSKEVQKVRAQLEQWEKLGEVLEADPELYKQVVSSIDKLSGKKTDTTENDQVSEKLNDTRLASESQIINGFEQKYHITQLSPEKGQELRAKIGKELAEMLDSTGKKTVQQVIDSISLTKLPVYLEKAYKLATADDKDEQTRLAAVIEDRQNREAMFSSSSSASLKTGKGLTDQERKVAQKMGISEEKYLKQKQAIENE